MEDEQLVWTAVQRELIAADDIDERSVRIDECEHGTAVRLDTNRGVRYRGLEANVAWSEDHADALTIDLQIDGTRREVRAQPLVHPGQLPLECGERCRQELGESLLTHVRPH